MIKPVRQHLLGASVGLCLLLGGCQNPGPVEEEEDLVLAEVENRVVTLSAYRRHVERVPAALREEVRPQRLLQAIIDEELLLQEAQRRGLEQFAEVRQALQKKARELALGELYRREGIETPAPSEEGLRTYFARSPYNRRVRFSLLMVKDPEKIPPLVQQLKEGADFEALSIQHSQDLRILSRNADMGYHRWGETMPSHQALTAQAFTMQPGQIAGPMQVADGYFLIKVTDVHPISFEQERETIARLVMQEQLAGQLAGLCARLQQRYELQVDEQGVKALWEAVEGNATAASRMVLTHTGGSLSLEQGLELLQTGDGGVPSSLEDLRQRLVRQTCRQVLMPLEIERLGLAESALVQAGLEKARKQLLIRRLERQITARPASPNQSLLRLYFENNKKRYLQSVRVEARRMPVRDPETGRQVMAQLRAGEDTLSLVERFVDVTYNGGALKDTDPIDRALLSEEGSIHGPFATEHGYIVLQVLRRLPAQVPPLEQIEAQVAADFREEQGKQLFQSFLRQLRERRAGQVKIYLQRLHRLKSVSQEVSERR